MLFLNTDEHLLQKDIAEKVGVSQKTLSKWVRAEGWDDIRVSISATRSQQGKNAARQLAELNAKIGQRPEGERFASPKEADTMLKLSKTIREMKEGVSVGDVIAVSTGLLSHIRAIDPDKARELSFFIDSYVKQLL